MSDQPLSQSFYNRDPRVVAQQLLGKRLLRVADDGVTIGRVVETEAYLADGDSANHAHRGRTRRNASMFGEPGLAYVYSIHARFCLNAVTEPGGTASAVLIRAVEPIEGIELMQQRRGRENLLDLARGPARLCEAFAVCRELDGCDLTSGHALWIAEDQNQPDEQLSVATSARIGVTSAEDLPLRYFVAASRFVSGSRRLNALDT